MAEEMDPNLVERFFNNECSSGEAEAVSAFFVAHPEALDVYFAIEEWQNALKEDGFTTERKLAIKKIIDKKTTADRGIFKLPLLRYAAAVILLVAMTVSALYIINKKQAIPIVDETVFVISNTTLFNKDTILPDGSIVQLQPGARLSYKADFINKRWVVVEEGMVQFEEKKTGRPFIAMAQGIATTPIGTRFSVNSIPAKGTVEIILLEGKVKVNALNTAKSMTEMVLAPGDKLLIHVPTMTVTLTVSEKQLKKAVQKHVTPAVKEVNRQDAVWTNNAINFSQTALSVVFDKIAARYNVLIIYDKEEIARYRFTGNIYYNDNIDKLLKNICDVNGLVYTSRGDTLRIYKAGTPTP